MKHRLTGLVFDVDGTLADTEEIHRRAFNATFREYGLGWNWTPDTYGRLLAISGGCERMTAYAREQPDPALGKVGITTLHQRKTARYAAMLEAGHVRLRPGVRRLLLEARARGITLAIATSSARSNLEVLLDQNLQTGWRDWFTAIETCNTVSEKKPSPAVYQAALRNAGLDSTTSIALEDTVNGLLAATRAGLRTVITTHRYSHGQQFPGAALVVDSLGEPGLPPTEQQGTLGDEDCVTLTVLERLLGTPLAT